MIPSDHVRAKGVRIATTGGVTRTNNPEIPGSTYRVEGASDTYHVWLMDLANLIAKCTCPAGEHGRICSHIWAAFIIESDREASEKEIDLLALKMVQHSIAPNLERAKTVIARMFGHTPNALDLARYQTLLDSTQVNQRDTVPGNLVKEEA